MLIDRSKLQNYLNPKPNWYKINNLSAAETELFIYDEISFYGVTADQFKDDLNSVTAERLVVRLNSPGGDVFDGIAIYNALRQHPAHVVTKVDSLAASIASVIFQAGDERVMMPKSQMMIHEASGLTVGNAEDARKFSDLLDKQSELIASIYADRSEADQAHFRNLMKAETWLSDKEAVDLGLADSIAELPSKPTNKVVNSSEPVDWKSFLADQEAQSLGGIF